VKKSPVFCEMIPLSDFRQSQAAVHPCLLHCVRDFTKKPRVIFNQRSVTTAPETSPVLRLCQCYASAVTTPETSRSLGDIACEFRRLLRSFCRGSQSGCESALPQNLPSVLSREDIMPNEHRTWECDSHSMKSCARSPTVARCGSQFCRRTRRYTAAASLCAPPPSRSRYARTAGEDRCDRRREISGGQSIGPLSSSGAPSTLVNICTAAPDRGTGP
jgi:hypothetical protein